MRHADRPYRPSRRELHGQCRIPRTHRRQRVRNPPWPHHVDPEPGPTVRKNDPHLRPGQRTPHRGLRLKVNYGPGAVRGPDEPGHGLWFELRPYGLAVVGEGHDAPASRERFDEAK